jgi:lysophospholipase L1-like esterase
MERPLMKTTRFTSWGALLFMGTMLLESPVSAAPIVGDVMPLAVPPLAVGQDKLGTVTSKFALDVPDGNYDVSLVIGGAAASETTCKAEARRLILESIRTAPGEKQEHSFTLNVRDGQLNLEFLGVNPTVSDIKVTLTQSAPTVYIAGDSTVCDQRDEPWAGWGQILPRFFKPGIAVANHAFSGRALKSFIWEKRLDAILKTIKKGDYLFVQFAHNDQKPGAAHADPFTTYQEQLQIYIDAAREHGATPVLVTSMNRRTFNAQGKIDNSLGDYPAAMRQKALAENVALIDLNAMSQALYEAWGPEDSKKAFVHFPAHTFPNQETALKDNTHFTAYGAYELAKCVVEGIRASNLDLKTFLVDTPAFDPAHPDSFESITIPSSPYVPIEKPAGN